MTHREDTSPYFRPREAFWGCGDGKRKRSAQVRMRGADALGRAGCTGRVTEERRFMIVDRLVA